MDVNEQILINLRTIMVLIFNGSFIFILSDFKVSMKKAAQYLIMLFLAVGCINLVLMLIFSWKFIVSISAFTIVLPTFGCICFLSKDGLWKTVFNYCFQLNIFFILYFISSLTIYIFEISIMTDILLRFIYFGTLLFIHIKFIRKQFREFARYIDKGWAPLSLVSLTMASLFMFYIIAVILNYKNPLTYSIFALLCLLAMGIYVVMYITFRNTYDLMLKLQIEENMNLQIALQKEQYNAIRSRMETDTIFRHDLRHHANLLIGMLSNDQADEALAYVRKLGTLTIGKGAKNYCENLVVNTILSCHVERARARGIQVKSRAIIPENIGIDEIQLCTMLSNLLENAVEHCAGNPAVLVISVLQNKGQLCIRIENSFDGIIKGDENGVGLRSVAAIVEKHGGTMNICHSSTTFTVDLLVDLNK